MITELLKYGLEKFGLYYGTYKAKVIDVHDPDNCGRILVSCPQVHGMSGAVWAYPKSPYGGKNFGLWAVPDTGDWVYVSFDHGRPEYPLWEGGWWGEGEVTSDMTPRNVVLATSEGMKVVIDRDMETVLIQQSNGNNLLITPDHIDIQSTGLVNISSNGVPMSVVTSSWLTWFNTFVWPKLIPLVSSPSAPIPPAPATSLTSVLKAQ